MYKVTWVITHTFAIYKLSYSTCHMIYIHTYRELVTRDVFVRDQLVERFPQFANHTFTNTKAINARNFQPFSMLPLSSNLAINNHIVLNKIPHYMGYFTRHVSKNIAILSLIKIQGVQ